MVGRFEIKQGRKSRKVGTFGEKVGLYFLNGVGEGEKNAFLLLFLACKSRISVLRSEKHLVKLIFSAQNEILGKKIQ